MKRNQGLIYKKIVSRKIAERPQTGILNNFKSFIKQAYQKKRRKILSRKRIKIITSEQK